MNNNDNDKIHFKMIFFKIIRNNQTTLEKKTGYNIHRIIN